MEGTAAPALHIHVDTGRDDMGKGGVFLRRQRGGRIPTASSHFWLCEMLEACLPQGKEGGSSHGMTSIAREPSTAPWSTWGSSPAVPAQLLCLAKVVSGTSPLPLLLSELFSLLGGPFCNAPQRQLL